MRGNELDLAYLVSNLSDGSAAFLQRVFLGTRASSILVLWSAKERTLHELVDMMIGYVGEVRRKHDRMPDEVYVLTPTRQLHLSREHVRAMLMSYSGNFPRAFKKALTELGDGRKGLVCSPCPFNSMNLPSSVRDPVFFTFWFLPGVRNAELLRAQLSLDPGPHTPCVQCFLDTLDRLGKAVKALPVIEHPQVTSPELKGTTRLLPPPQNYELLEEVPTEFGTLRVVRPYQDGGGRIYSAPIALMPELDDREKEFYSILTAKLDDLLAREDLYILYREDREGFARLVRRKAMEALSSMNSDLPPLSVKKVINWVVESREAGPLAPLLAAIRRMGITDINMVGGSTVTIRVLRPISGYNTLATNLVMSPEDVYSVLSALAERKPSAREVKGVLETTVTYPSGDLELVLRISLARTPDATTGNVRVMLPTSFYHFVYKYGNMSASVLALLVALFPHLTTVFLGEPGSVKTTLVQILLLSLKAGAEVLYVAESHELDWATVPDVTIIPLSIETDLERSATRLTKVDVLKVGLRRRGLVFLEEVRETSMLEFLLQEAAIRQVVTTVHASSPRDFIRRFKDIGLERLKAIDVLVQMQRYTVAGHDRFVVEGVYALTNDGLIELAGIRRRGDEVWWEVLEPAEIVEIFREKLAKRRGITPERLERFMLLIEGYLGILEKYKEDLDLLSPFSPLLRLLDRKVCVTIHDALESDLSVEETMKLVEEIVKNRLRKELALL